LGFGVYLNVSGSLALEFEHEKAAVMTGGNEVDLLGG